MAITITNEGHILDKKLIVQQGGAAIVGATSITGNTGITGDLGVTGDSAFAGDVAIDGIMSTLQPVLIDPEDESPPLVLGEQAQGQWVEGFNADLLDGLDSTDFMQRAANGTVSAVHTFNPVSVGPAFNLGANAKGQWVDGLNSDYLDGLHGSSFLKLATAQTITAVHTFNPASAGAPFTLGANALGYVVSGFNADLLDGLNSTDFVQIATAGTITARHTFSPSTVASPFILGANAQGQLVSGLNADLLDGLNSTDFVRNTTAGTITAVHTFSPVIPGAPFELGANAQGQLVTGLNADLLDGLNSTHFVRNTTAGTITAVHTFSPVIPGAPFVLGANAQGQLVTGLNADLLDGKDINDLMQLGGAPGGQTAYGGTMATDNLVLNSTTHATKGQVRLGLDGSKISMGASQADILTLGAMLTLYKSSPVYVEMASDTNTGGQTIAEIVSLAKTNSTSTYDYRQQAGFAFVMEGTTDYKRGSRIEVKTRKDNDGATGARRIATFTTGGNLNIGTAASGPATACSAVLFIEEGVNPVNTRADHCGFFATSVGGVSTGACINSNGVIVKLMQQAGIAAVNTKSLTPITNDYGVADHVIEDVTSNWAASYVAVRRNFKECTTEINNLITVVEDLRTKFDRLVNQHETAGFNAAA